jgi:hypothetical protein
MLPAAASIVNRRHCFQKIPALAEGHSNSSSAGTAAASVPAPFASTVRTVSARVVGVCETAEETMSQIASKVCYHPSHRPVALPGKCNGARIGLRCAPYAMPLDTPSPMLHRPRLATNDPKTARNADCVIAIEPLRAPGYASSTANAPRHALIELPRPRNGYVRNRR